MDGQSIRYILKQLFIFEMGSFLLLYDALIFELSFFSLF